MSALLPGAVFDEKCRIISVLGSGTFGTVYKAEEMDLNRLVAVKVLNLWSGGEEQAEVLQRFRREAKALSLLAHPNILKVFRFGLEPVPYLVSEFAEGESLRSILEKSGALPFGELKAIAVQLAEALRYAHDKGVIHRDLKPENLIVKYDVSGKPEIKLIDFGLCKPEGNSAKTNSQVLTGTGQLVGTAGYMSPEQVLGQKVEQRTDIYSYACIVFEMVSGMPAFRADNIPDLLMKQLNEPFPSLISLNPNSGLPAEFDGLLQTCASKNPSDRPANFSKVLELLEDVHAYPALKFHTANPARSRLSNTLLTIAFCLTALILIVYSFQSFSSSLPPAEYTRATVEAVRDSLAKKNVDGARVIAKEKIEAKAFASWPAMQRADLYYQLFIVFRDAADKQDAELYLVKFLKTSWPLHNPKTDDPDWGNQITQCHKFIMGEGISRRSWKELNPVFQSLDLVVLKKCISPRSALLATELYEESNVRTWIDAPDLVWEVYCRHMLANSSVADEMKCQDLYERFMARGLNVAVTRGYRNHQAYAFAVKAGKFYRMNDLKQAKFNIDKCMQILREIADSDHDGILKFSTRMQIYESEQNIYDALIREASRKNELEKLNSYRASLQKSQQERMLMQSSQKEQDETRHEIFKEHFHK